MKMAAGLLLLVCVGAVVHSARAQDSYRGLPGDYKKGVDLALEQLNTHPGVQHNFRFWRSVAKSDIESGFGVKYFYHQFYLKPTTCDKGATVSDSQTCPFRNDRPLIDCAVCYKTASDQIESSPKPYVHCMQRPRLTEGMRTARLEHCRQMNYNSGAPTLLAVSTGTK
ncbi:hypothetical protein EYF80_048198 [Liparis tanakae]|uniref:Retinoic acid receptor responder protein 2 n=1 Tax=Liparis tanakae TaxID=230148 RepID=A0A4Z2FLG5_9TELE|nr:hypothetical protein EYF80_048198 [Liparis tanakae]